MYSHVRNTHRIQSFIKWSYFTNRGGGGGVGGPTIFLYINSFLQNPGRLTYKNVLYSKCTKIYLQNMCFKC